MIQLTKTTVEDLETLFTFQVDEESMYMAAFTPENPFDKEFYIQKWTKIVSNPDICMRTLRVNGTIVGSVVHFELFDQTNVAYWIDRKYWGQGIATQGLQLFMQETSKRPLYGRVVSDNTGSQRVLEKCGFRRIGENKAFANGRNAEVEEYIYSYDE